MTVNANFVYMTAGNRQEAEAVGAALVEAKLAACINIVENMTSMFIWQGAAQHETEVVVIAKTVAERVPALIEKVRSIHSYECPCIVCLPITDGNPDFLEWIAEEVEL